MEGWPFETSWGLRGNPVLTARYEVLKRIGGGNYGDVFQGRRKADNLIVALKEIHDQQSSRRELDALLRLDNPNVVKLLEYFRQGSSVVLVLEYAPFNLADVIAAGPLGEAVIKGIMLQLLQGLSVCHSASIVHRDLKPSNILLTADGLLKIADFGNARIMEENGLDSRKEEQEPGKLTVTGSKGSFEVSSSDPVLVAAYSHNEEHGQLAVKGSEGSSEMSTQEPVLVAASITGVARKRNYLQKFKLFLKKNSRHSRKPEQVKECDGLRAQSGFVGSDHGGYGESQHRSSTAGTNFPGFLSTHEVHQAARKVSKVANSQAVHHSFDSVYGATSMEGMDQPAPLGALHTESAGRTERSHERSVPVAGEDYVGVPLAKSHLPDVLTIDEIDVELAEACPEHWSDAEKGSESGQDGWHKASGGWVLDTGGLAEEVSGWGQAGIGSRLEDNRWYGHSKHDDSYFDKDRSGQKEVAEQEPPWSVEHKEHPEKPEKGKGLYPLAMDLSSREQNWGGCARADGSESPYGWSDKSFGTSGIDDRAMDCRSDFTGCVGTRWYKSPEILYGATKYGKAIDLWAVGLILAELLKGEPLFRGVSDIDQLSRIVKFLGPPTESSWPGVSELPDYDKISFVLDCPPSVLVEEFPTASKMSLRFLEKFLVYNPVQRLTAKEALGDVFFSADPVPALPHEIKVQSHHQAKAGNSGEWSD